MSGALQWTWPRLGPAVTDTARLVNELNTRLGRLQQVLSYPNGIYVAGSYLLGDTFYADTVNSFVRLPGNLTTTKQYLSQTGTGAASAAPAWAQVAFADLSGRITYGQLPNGAGSWDTGGGLITITNTLTVSGLLTASAQATVLSGTGQLRVAYQAAAGGILDIRGNTDGSCDLQMNGFTGTALLNFKSFSGAVIGTLTNAGAFNIVAGFGATTGNFSGLITASGGITSATPIIIGTDFTTGGVTGILKISGNVPGWALSESDQGVDGKAWRFYANGGTLNSTLYKDDGSAETVWLSVVRSGITISSITLGGATTISGLLTASAGIVSTQKITTYNNVATVGWGVPAIYGTGRSTGQTGDVASVATYTVGAADGSFLISCNVLVTTYVAGTQSIKVDYTDEGGTARTLTLTTSSLGGTLGITVGAAGPAEGIAIQLRCKASTSITIKTVGSLWNGTYNVEASIMQIT